MQDWLAGVYLLDADMDVDTERQILVNGECLVSQQGDIYTAHSLSYFGAQSPLHGVLERQAHLEALKQQLPMTHDAVAQAQVQLTQIDARPANLAQ